MYDNCAKELRSPSASRLSLSCGLNRVQNILFICVHLYPLHYGHIDRVAYISVDCKNLNRHKV